MLLDVSSKNSNDPLMNERAFCQLLRAEFEKSLRHLYHFSLMIIEPDLLISAYDDNADFHIPFARQITRTIRETDTLSMIGEQTYYLFLYKANPLDVLAIFSRIRFYIENYDFTINNESVKITVSAGAASIPFHCNDLCVLIRNCDELLKQAQNNGGNDICLPEPLFF